MKHELKTALPYWLALRSGEKRFEVRRDDRGFQKGDEIDCLLFDKAMVTEMPSYLDDPNHRARVAPQEAARLSFRVLWILTGGQFGIEPGYVVMSLEAT